MKFALCCLLVVPCAVRVEAQQVLVVDSAGGAFTNVQAAVNAAQPGDTVLVRPGAYGAVTINRSVALVGDGPGVNLPWVAVAGTAAGSTVLVQGIRAVQSSLSQVAFPSLTIDGCAGEVWIQDCDFDASDQSTDPFANAGSVIVSNSSAVTMIDVVAVGSYSPIGRSALDVAGSTVHVFGGNFTGGTSVPTAVAAGLLAVDATVVLHGATVTGGEGFGGAHPGLCSNDGGPGVLARGATTVIDVGSTFVGGQHSTLCTMPPSVSGPPTQIVLPAMLRQVNSAPLTMSASAVAREGQSVDYTVTGTAGDNLALAFALQPGAFYLELIQSSLLVGTNFVGIPIGSLPVSGVLTIPTVVPSLGTGVDVSRFYVQVLALRTNATLAGGTGRALTLLDVAF